MRTVTRRAAFGPEVWDRSTAAEVPALFDGLATEWHTRASQSRLDPVLDALARGGPFPAGRWLEVGSGAGLVTATVARHAGTLVALDLAMQMLLRAAPVAPRVRGDASRLPFPAASFDVVVMVNAFVFPVETARVLARGGRVIWVNTSGPATPIYLSAEDVVLAMGEGWGGRASEAACGTWTVLYRL